MSETTDLYWDCNCVVNYIHEKATEHHCVICGVKETDGYVPDSVISEVIEHLENYLSTPGLKGDACVQDAEQNLQILRSTYGNSKDTN